MKKQDRPGSHFISSLKERVKELNCLYQVESLLKNPEDSPDFVLRKLVRVFPSGWQFPKFCEARILYKDQLYTSSDVAETPWSLQAAIRLKGKPVGKIKVFYTHELNSTMGSLFLEEEKQLIHTIADRIGHYLYLHDLLKREAKITTYQEKQQESILENWHIIVELLFQSDRRSYENISRKMLIYLCLNGVKEAVELIDDIQIAPVAELEVRRGFLPGKEAIPQKTSERVFQLAEKHLDNEEVLGCIQRWMQESRYEFFIKTLINPNSTLQNIFEAIHFFHHLLHQGVEVSDTIRKEAKVNLLRRLFSEQLEYLMIAKSYVDIHDFNYLTKTIIHPPNSHGKLGGKAAGVFLASSILELNHEEHHLNDGVDVPKTWYITSDAIYSFIQHNNLEEVSEQKYKSIEQVISEYPLIRKLLERAELPASIIRGLSSALDDLQERPLVVRSSSLLGDRLGVDFASKYEFRYVANRGSKEYRLNELARAVLTVYSSVFGPEPIRTRIEHGLTDFNEEMGILIQEIVGKKHGHYYFPLLTGMVTSATYDRRKPRRTIKAAEIRLNLGIGGRIDQHGSNYSDLRILLDGQSIPADEKALNPDNLHFSYGSRMRVFNVEEGKQESVDVFRFFASLREEAVELAIDSLVDAGLQTRNRTEREKLLYRIYLKILEQTSLLEIVNRVVEQLETALKSTVQLTFATDGETLYLLQCFQHVYSDEYLRKIIREN